MNKMDNNDSSDKNGSRKAGRSRGYTLSTPEPQTGFTPIFSDTTPQTTTTPNSKTGSTIVSSDIDPKLKAPRAFTPGLNSNVTSISTDLIAKYGVDGLTKMFREMQATDSKTKNSP